MRMGVCTHVCLNEHALCSHPYTSNTCIGNILLHNVEFIYMGLFVFE